MPVHIKVMISPVCESSFGWAVIALASSRVPVGGLAIKPGTEASRVSRRKAQFYDIELGGKCRVLDTAALRGDVELAADNSHARNRGTDHPLPRIAPLRASLAIDYGDSRWSARAELQHAWSPNFRRARNRLRGQVQRNGRPAPPVLIG
ncbi:hemoglobin-haptoglobin utilization protein B [Mycetohabitans rhizoxinica HKI 454]|uniref:Hemoglobin-haptoglobin utilization protein B n=1 Tax=Mycetohabitans rhizoxinica (strain DSM 19002 / CIP 109453 / HKI 454) TaxID=882378 RepID=E5AS24_MYCRK|nr:hemoglobin-haptoglobin utilization protein B [Mycetohabitans rhizoxinica HKI 454]